MLCSECLTIISSPGFDEAYIKPDLRMEQGYRSSVLTFEEKQIYIPRPSLDSVAPKDIDYILYGIYMFIIEDEKEQEEKEEESSMAMPSPRDDEPELEVFEEASLTTTTSLDAYTLLSDAGQSSVDLRTTDKTACSLSAIQLPLLEEKKETETEESSNVMDSTPETSPPSTTSSDAPTLLSEVEQDSGEPGTVNEAATSSTSPVSTTQQGLPPPPSPRQTAPIPAASSLTSTTNTTVDPAAAAVAVNTSQQLGTPAFEKSLDDLIGSLLFDLDV
jgi:hypothetical protein